MSTVNIRKIIILFGLLLMLVLPCVSFASSFDVNQQLIDTSFEEPGAPYVDGRSNIVYQSLGTGLTGVIDPQYVSFSGKLGGGSSAGFISILCSSSPFDTTTNIAYWVSDCGTSVYVTGPYYGVADFAHPMWFASSPEWSNILDSSKYYMLVFDNSGNNSYSETISGSSVDVYGNGRCYLRNPIAPHNAIPCKTVADVYFDLGTGVGDRSLILSSLKQYKADGVTEIAEGSDIADPAIIFSAILSSVNNNQVKLQVELKEIDKQFDAKNLLESNFVGSGNVASVAKDFIPEGAYHWRARIMDSTGNAGVWKELGALKYADVVVTHTQAIFGTTLPSYTDHSVSQKAGVFVPFYPGYTGTINSMSVYAQGATSTDSFTFYIVENMSYGSYYSSFTQFYKNSACTVSATVSAPLFPGVVDFSLKGLYMRTFPFNSSAGGPCLSATPGFVLKPNSSWVVWTFGSGTLFGSSEWLGPNLCRNAYFSCSPVYNLYLSFNTAASLNSTPSSFWAEISGDTGASMLMTGTSSAATAMKQLPNGWAVHVLNTKDKDGKAVTTPKDATTNYRWYQVEDATDNTVGWMLAGIVDATSGNFVSGGEYLKYDASKQVELEEKAAKIYTTWFDRANKIVEAIDHYYNNASTTATLYSSADKSKISELKSIPLFRVSGQTYSMGSFPEDVILGFLAYENGPSFNNENVSYDFGHGIGQITIKDGSYDNRGIYSDLRIYPCALGGSKFKNCYAPDLPSTPRSPLHYEVNPIDGNLYKFYSNSSQSIYANLKDSLGKLNTGLKPYVSTKPYMGHTEWNVSSTQTGTTTVSLADMRKIVAVKAYNGLGGCNDPLRDLNGVHSYLGNVATRVEELSNYYPNKIATPSALDLAQKMRLAEQNHTSINICSPGELRVLNSSGDVLKLNEDGIPNAFYDEQNGKAAVVYFPDPFYKYQVVGTEAGAYSLYFDNVNQGATSTVEFHNAPLSLGEIYTYQIDQEALSRGEKGVIVQIDNNGDGVSEKIIHTGTIVDGNIAPTTVLNVAGKHGTNDWYVSDVSVVLDANDAGGVGVEKTMYSLDGGVWQVYATTSPILIDTDGEHSIQYYSIDYFDKAEATSTQVIKIDKTPPEAKISFNSETQKLLFEGVDSSTTILQTGATSTLITDSAGNTLRVVISKNNQEKNEIKFEIKSLVYNTASATSTPKTTLQYEWAVGKTGKIKELEQKISIGDMEIRGHYDAKNNITEIIRKFNRKENHHSEKQETKEALPGIKVLGVRTNKGAIQCE